MPSREHGVVPCVGCHPQYGKFRSAAPLPLFGMRTIVRHVNFSRAVVARQLAILGRISPTGGPWPHELTDVRRLRPRHRDAAFRSAQADGRYNEVTKRPKVATALGSKSLERSSIGLPSTKMRSAGQPGAGALASPSPLSALPPTVAA